MNQGALRQTDIFGQCAWPGKAKTSGHVILLKRSLLPILDEMGGDSVTLLKPTNFLSHRCHFSGCIGCRNERQTQIGKEYPIHDQEIAIVE
jgi:hypothetical protein